MSASQVIQAILAPAIMISSCGLLLLGLQNRYSFIVNRIRLLNEERRRSAKQLSDGKELEPLENFRYKSVMQQIKELSKRAHNLRNSILLLITAVLFFVLTSLLIALFYFYPYQTVELLPLISFLLGMVSIFIGVALLAKDIITAYRVIKLEIQVEE